MCLTIQAVAYPQTLWMKRWAAFRRWITASRRKHNGQEVNQGAVKKEKKEKKSALPTISYKGYCMRGNGGYSVCVFPLQYGCSVSAYTVIVLK